MNSNPTEKQLLKSTNNVRKAKELIIPMKWSRRKVILGALGKNNQSYGLQLPNKLIHDVNDRLTSIDRKKNCADVSLMTYCRNIITGIIINVLLYLGELQTASLNKLNGKFSIR